MKYSHEILDQLRLEGDKSADTIIEEFYQTHQDIKQINNLLLLLLKNNFVIPAELPDFFKSWLESESIQKEETNFSTLEKHSSFYAKNAFAISLLLSTSSLLEGYASSPGNKVLAFSHRLEYDVKRRIAETAQFNINVQSPKSFEANGKAIPCLLKVRLMHASIRHLISNSGRWDSKQYGVPICQEDLLGTLMCFSIIIARDLPKIGIAITKNETENMLYFWNIAGNFMGIKNNAIPNNIQEAEELVHLIAERNQIESIEGKLLTKGLIEFHKSLMPGHIFNIAPALMRHLVGNEMADMLGIEISTMDHWIKGNTFKKVVQFADLWGKSLISAEMFKMDGYQRSKFDMPEHLTNTWNKEHSNWKESFFHLKNFIH